MEPAWHVVLSMGFLLCAALLGGQLAAYVHLPRVTAYLLVGIMCGVLATTFASTGDASTQARFLAHILHDVERLNPLAHLAMALVLFSIGCRFPLPRVRRIMRRVLPLSAGELLTTLTLVCGGLLLIGVPWQQASLFGVLALATAPATTVLVLKENESEGPVTEYTVALLVLNNLAAIIGFETLLLLVEVTGAETPRPVWGELVSLAKNLCGSAVLGHFAGLTVSFGCNVLAQTRWLVLLIAISTAMLGLCGWWGMPYLLAFLVMGATVANSSDRTEQISGELDRVVALLAVVFFVLSGVEMDLNKLWLAGKVGVAYIVLRSVGKCLGVFLVARQRHDGPHVQRWLGPAMLSQAGAAIALATLAKQHDPQLGEELLTVILGTVIFFEIVGPVLVRQAVLRSGEVPLAKAIYHTSTTIWGEFLNMVNRLLVALGRDSWAGRSPEQLTVGQLMQAHLKGIPAGDDFDQLVDYIERSHENTYPVVDQDNVLFGVIRYADVRDALFFPRMGRLVCAADLSVPTDEYVYADDPLATAWKHFVSSSDDSWPVVTREEPHRLVGVVRRRDVIRLFRRGGAGPEG